MKKITSRINHTRIENGYCFICKSYGKLTKDHVPPKGSVIITKREQKSISECLGEQYKEINGLKIQRASVFKTICYRCNSEILGKLDNHFCNVIKMLSDKVNDHFITKSNIYNSVHIPFNSHEFTRAMVGHVLSATSITSCMKPIIDNDFFTPLRKFVLGEISTYENTHDIYYWFYPHATHISAQGIAFYNEGNICICSLLYFFPIAFLITLKGQGTYPTQANKLEIKDKMLFLDLSTFNINYSSFPFIDLKDNQMMMFNDGFTCISYPINY
ncbi:chaperonin [Pectobacterium brasiliense]|uniref:chaperonin n=1 Tax=Pectobacterium brasiliense TaxID=180957 RepID=UPI003018624B